MTAAFLIEPKSRTGLEARIIQYFRENPECELTPEAIGQKFGCSVGTARNTLTAMRQRGLITSHHVVRPTPSALSISDKEQAKCQGKASFTTMQRAKDRAARMRQRYEVEVSPYKCQHCGGIHLGSGNKLEGRKGGKE